MKKSTNRMELISGRLPRRKGYYLCVNDPDTATLHVLARFVAKTDGERKKACDVIQRACVETIKRHSGWDKQGKAG